MCTSSRSPARAFVDGFSGDPFTRTWPTAHNRVAGGPDLTEAHRAEPTIDASPVGHPGAVTGCRIAPPREGATLPLRPRRSGRTSGRHPPTRPVALDRCLVDGLPQDPRGASSKTRVGPEIPFRTTSRPPSNAKPRSLPMSRTRSDVRMCPAVGGVTDPAGEGDRRAEQVVVVVNGFAGGDPDPHPKFGRQALGERVPGTRPGWPWSTPARSPRRRTRP